MPLLMDTIDFLTIFLNSIEITSQKIYNYIYDYIIILIIVQIIDKRLLFDGEIV